jgi:GNAT superfamily N-acetyltransferase
MIAITKATTKNIKDIAPLFDAYRVFYKQVSNLEAAKSFLKDRLTTKESVIFIAWVNGAAVGFTQLFPTFSSVSMQRSFVLNDLYVDANQRKKGIGKALLNHAKQFCIKKRYKGLALETATDNPAQKLYEQLDWKKDTEVYHYFWKNPSS